MKQPRSQAGTLSYSVSRAAWAPSVALLTVLSLSVGCAGQDASAPSTQVRPGAQTADDLLVVDCLLPSQVRKLGQNFTYMGPRRPIKTSGRDCEIRGGEYVAYDRANYATALKAWLPLAETGDAAAQTYVGEIFEKGLGVPPDYDAAATWYRRAAESGYSRAAINLGNLYEQGLGVPKNPTQALNWYRRAAGLGELTFDIVPGTTSAELQQSRRQIAELRGQLEGKEAELDKAQLHLAPLEKRLDELQREADDLRRKLSPPQVKLSPPATKDSPPQPAGRDALPSRADEAALAAKQQEISFLREQIARIGEQGGLKTELANLRQALAQAEAELVPLRAGLQPIPPEATPGGPRIQLKQVQMVEPPVLVPTRDARAGPVAVPGGPRSWIVVGHVVSDAGLKSLAINQRPRTLDKDNAFTIRLTEADGQLRIVATDRRERTSTLGFLLPVVQGDRPKPSESAAVRLTGPQVAQLSRSLGNYYALVIGNNAYRHIRPLQTAVYDAQEVAKVLREQYRFNVTLLTDATRYDILSALNDLRGKLNKDDNLLIYYAGHGRLDETSGRGYWMPVDADLDSNRNWIANEALTGILDAMAVRQLLLVADSCYSGTLTRSSMGQPQLKEAMTDQDALRLVQQMAQKRSRMAMTSGGVAPVLDGGGGRHSIFAEGFLTALRDNDGLLLGRDLFRQVQFQVAEMAVRLPLAQAPEYAPIKGGYEGGDFVIVRPAS